MSAWPPEMHSTEWHLRRQTGVTGSDIVVLAGLSPYGRGVHDIYLDKTEPPKEDKPSPVMEVGSVIEDAIATLYARRTGRKLTRSHVLLRSKTIPWAIGNVDRFVKGERRLVEIKNRRYLAKGELAPDVHAQIMWYLGVVGYPVADAAILVGGNDLQIIEVPFDPPYFADLVEIGRDFWDHVERREPPPIDGSEAAARYLAHLYPQHHGDAFAAADPGLDALARQYQLARTEGRDAADRMDAAANAIKVLLGETPGVQGDGWRVTWKRSADYPRPNWTAIAAETLPLLADDTASEIVARNTTLVEGTRRFVATFDEEATA